MRSRYFPKFTSEGGSTLAEVCIAIVVMTIVVIGGFQFVSVGRERLALEKYYRLALMEAASRLESARKYSYDALSDRLSETNTSITLGNITAKRTTIVSSIDDNFDGTGASDADTNPTDYKKIRVTVSWPPDHSVSLENYQSEYYYEISY